MKLGNIRKLPYEDLACYTNNFHESNYLGHFQFGKFYHGKIVSAERTLHVMVKIWEIPVIYNYRNGDNERRLMDEVILFRNETVNNHPGLPKLYGYCLEGGHLGIVYEFKPFDSLYNLIPKDGFTWLQRIKFAIGFASLLKFLHSLRCPGYKPIIIRNLDCAHVVLDEDYKPKLCDFGLVTGGIFPDRTIYKFHHVYGAFGYIDYDSVKGDGFSETRDVYAFGAILLSLFSKRVFSEEDRQNRTPDVCEWALSEMSAYYNSGEDKPRLSLSLVHQSLTDEPDFEHADGVHITTIALNCIFSDTSLRLNIDQVMRDLLSLRVVKKHADFFEVKKLM